MEHLNIEQDPQRNLYVSTYLRASADNRNNTTPEDYVQKHQFYVVTGDPRESTGNIFMDLYIHFPTMFIRGNGYIMVL